MTAKTELQAQLEAAKIFEVGFSELIQKAEATIKSMPDDVGMWRPSEGEEYFIVSAQGEVDQQWNSNQTWTDRHISIGNCFQTRALAERHVRNLKTMQKLRELAKGFVPDWGVHGQNKFYFYWDYRSKKPIGDYCSAVQFIGTIYFRTAADRDDAIKAVGDDALRELVG